MQSFGDDPEEGMVLVVDDEPEIAEMYATMLEDLHTVNTATNGKAALDLLSDETDVVLLDRSMPGLSGSEVLECIREESYDCRVAMVTAIEPDVEIIDMEFDTYVVKPVRQEDLREVVESLLLRSQYSRCVQELMQITSKLVTLESQISDTVLGDHPEYQELRERKERLEAANQMRIDELVERGDSVLLFQDVLR